MEMGFSLAIDYKLLIISKVSLLMQKTLKDLSNGNSGTIFNNLALQGDSLKILTL